MWCARVRKNTRWFTGVPRSEEITNPPGSPKVPRHRANVGCYGGAISDERGTPRVPGQARSGHATCGLSRLCWPFGHLCFDFSQQRRTPCYSVKRICRKALRPFGLAFLTLHPRRGWKGPGKWWRREYNVAAPPPPRENPR